MSSYSKGAPRPPRRKRAPAVQQLGLTEGFHLYAYNAQLEMILERLVKMDEVAKDEWPPEQQAELQALRDTLHKASESIGRILASPAP